MKNFALHKSSESVCIQGIWWKPEAEHTGVCENRKSAKLPECERFSPIYLDYVPDSFVMRELQNAAWLDTLGL
ncbi:hypothetical protein [Listeria booriae]|uniref:hypothetical protein n=1 Tax=Listeria booriae TaxID=1552123 RepID=UPI001628B51A|nr:hypothetical protein [Listeria booriae]MBC2104867.1 hypothetical protein [Listeria booriae]